MIQNVLTLEVQLLWSALSFVKETVAVALQEALVIDDVLDFEVFVATVVVARVRAG